jgi:hypothetical protein
MHRVSADPLVIPLRNVIIGYHDYCLLTLVCNGSNTPYCSGMAMFMHINYVWMRTSSRQPALADEALVCAIMQFQKINWIMECPRRPKMQFNKLRVILRKATEGRCIGGGHDKLAPTIVWVFV